MAAQIEEIICGRLQDIKYYIKNKYKFIKVEDLKSEFHKKEAPIFRLMRDRNIDSQLEKIITYDYPIWTVSFVDQIKEKERINLILRKEFVYIREFPQPQKDKSTWYTVFTKIKNWIKNIIKLGGDIMPAQIEEIICGTLQEVKDYFKEHYQFVGDEDYKTYLNDSSPTYRVLGNRTVESQLDEIKTKWERPIGIVSFLKETIKLNEEKVEYSVQTKFVFLRDEVKPDIY